MEIKKINRDTIKAMSDEELGELIELIRVESMSDGNLELWDKDNRRFIKMLDFIEIVRDEVSRRTDADTQVLAQVSKNSRL
jgi:predicted lipid-binding transport protein (Tim44 family)